MSGTGSIGDIVVDPLTRTTVYAAIFGGGESVYKSTDAGVTWEPANGGLPVGAQILSLAIDPSVPSNLFVAVYPGTPGSGYVWKTTDGEINWVEQTEGFYNPNVQAVAVDPTDSSVVYAGTGTFYDAGESFGVFRSTDGGVHWAPFNPGLTMPIVLALAIASDGSRIYAGTYYGGVFDLEP